MCVLLALLCFSYLLFLSLINTYFTCDEAKFFRLRLGSIQYLSLYINDLRQSTELRRVLAVCRNMFSFFLCFKEERKSQFHPFFPKSERNSLDLPPFPGKMKCLAPMWPSVVIVFSFPWSHHACERPDDLLFVDNSCDLILLRSITTTAFCWAQCFLWLYSLSGSVVVFPLIVFL